MRVSLGPALLLLLTSTHCHGADAGDGAGATAGAGADCVSSEDELNDALDTAHRGDVIKICDGDYEHFQFTMKTGRVKFRNWGFWGGGGWGDIQFKIFLVGNK